MMSLNRAEKKVLFASSAEELEMALRRALEDHCPLIDWGDTDHRILEIATNDLINWLKFHWNLRDNLAVAREIEEHIGTREFLEEVNVFATLWFNKWQSRTRLVFESKPDETKPKVQFLSSEQRREILEAIVFQLVSLGEICGTSIVANEVLRRAEARFDPKKHDVFTLLSSALRLARELAQSVGPLIFLKAEKGYFERGNRPTW